MQGAVIVEAFTVHFRRGSIINDTATGETMKVNGAGHITLMEHKGIGGRCSGDTAGIPEGGMDGRETGSSEETAVF